LQLFYGKRAWMGTHPLFIMSQVADGGLPFGFPTDGPPALAALLASCLHLDPAQRPTIAAVLAEVQQMTKEATPPRNSCSPRQPTSPLPPADASQQQQQQQQQQRPILGKGTSVTASRGNSLSSQSSVAAAGRARASTAVSPFAAAASIASQPSS
jgi:hypothetical protein